jgi:plastocyanin
MKRIVSLVAALAVAAATVFAAVAYAAPTQSTATKVKVTIKNFHFTLSKHSARHGKVTFVVTNKDSTKHDFKIAGKKTPMLKKNQSKSITVTLKKGKKYQYICTVPGHAQLGMKGSFKAT